MTSNSKSFLLKLARRTLERYFASGRAMDSHFHGNDKEGTSLELKEKRGTFVTLHKHGELRGCIGHIEPVQEIYKDVIDNTLAAAFEDTRFLPLEADELPEIKIEISVLTQPRELKYSSVDDLLVKLTPLRDGVIIRKGYRGATYLPQVWEDLFNKEEFLSSLCQKAGLPADEWKSGNLQVFTYQAEVFSENSKP
ncbi:MAG: AmmeMemoRadiSam system protein A [Candidatus Magasanikbacteria bacterium]|nr:AmmeMemoRadiSam system protein A [Candidatus Magasanikbacteria bacterium]